MLKKIKAADKNFLFFLLVNVFVGLSQSVDSSLFNAFIEEQFHMGPEYRAYLEFPRELPGFLVAVVISFIYLLGDVRIAVIANLTAAIGMFALGMIPANYALLLIFVFIYSMGMHLFMPLTSSIGMSFANEKNLGRRLGQFSSANTAALLMGTAILWVLFRVFHISFVTAFTLGAVSFALGALFLIFINKNQTVKAKRRFVFRKEYRLFYWMSILWGARKQIFLTFGPMLLLKKYGLRAENMIFLFFIIAVLGIVMKPIIGGMIDKLGEKFVLSLEAVILIILCFGYAFASDLLPFSAALVLVSACYIMDMVSSAANFARSTYLRKIALKPEDVSPSLSLSISLDHIPSMLIPALLVQFMKIDLTNGFKFIFMGGAVIALVNLMTVQRIKIHQPPSHEDGSV